MSLRAAAPIAAGHAASIALVVAAVSLDVTVDRALLQALAGGLLFVAAVVWLAHRPASRIRASAGQAGLALGSFVLATAHGTGLMLVPALVPFCTAGVGARGADASGALLQALAAVGVHSAAMLAIAGAIAMGIAMGGPLLRRPGGSAVELRRSAASACPAPWAGTPPRSDAPATHP
jgi:hypothetical protein